MTPLRHLLFLAGLLVSVFPLAAAVQITDLRCEQRENPLGIDVSQPRFSWKIESGERDVHQSASEILVATNADDLRPGHNPLWDSGKVSGDDTILIPYAGPPLVASAKYYWRVRIWDAHDRASAWSPAATWTMGLLAPSDWQARWITASQTDLASTLLRREFTVRPGLRRAVLHVCGLGQYELTLNGRRTDADFLSPGWTKYNRTCLYDTRDLTGLLKTGPNALGLFLGNGMYNVVGEKNRYTKFVGTFGLQKAIAQLRLEYADGTVETVLTDEQWQVAAGPVTFSSIYGGEDYDGRLAQPGWDKAGFIPDARWAAAVVTTGPGGELKGLSCAAPPIREFEIHEPVAVQTLTNGDLVYDLGQNTSHLPHLRLAGPAGSRIRLIPAELLAPDGSADQGSMGAGRRGLADCLFIKGTDREESWSPRFYYVGCRYLQVRLLPALAGGPLPKIKSLNATVVHGDAPAAGEFACSNNLFNRIRTLVRWAQMANMVSLMTDCPHRERLGWLEEDHLNGPALRYEFGLASLFTKTLNDIGDSQLTNGLVPTTAPEYTVFLYPGEKGQLRGIFGDSPEWSSSFILVPWQQYEFDGDLGLFRAHYEGMKKYLDYFGTRAANGIVNYGLGDWYDVGSRPPGYAQLTPVALTATAFYYQDAVIMARVATLLGRPDDAAHFNGLAETVRQAFNAQFYDANKHSYATGSQCANAIPLVMNLCEPANRAGVLAALVSDVRAHTNAITAGDVGYRYLLRALAGGGRNDVIFDLNSRSDKPGYGLQLARGATSLTEAWDAGRHSSQDHFMLGQIQEWFYHDLAGIRPDGPGFKTIIIAPQPVGDITWAKASYESVHGKIVSDWKRTAGKFVLKVTIPANTTATIDIPAAAGSVVKANSSAARYLRTEAGCQVFATGSGDYTFTVTDAKP